MDKKYLEKELKELFVSMDYIAAKLLLKKGMRRRSTPTFYKIYQQLGSLWQFLGLQCKHWDGYKKKDNKFLCKICGKEKNAKVDYFMLPVRGEKVIGRMTRPGINKPEKLSKKEAGIINDSIRFHGARLNVLVSNGYVSRFGNIGKDINVAADRIITLEENGLIVEISRFIAGMRMKAFKKQSSVYGGFLWELPKRILKKMPIILSFDKKGSLIEIELIRR